MSLNFLLSVSTNHRPHYESAKERDNRQPCLSLTNEVESLLLSIPSRDNRQWFVLVALESMSFARTGRSWKLDRISWNTNLGAQRELVHSIPWKTNAMLKTALLWSVGRGGGGHELCLVSNWKWSWVWWPIDPQNWNEETGGSAVQSQFHLHNDFEANLDYTKSSRILKNDSSTL